MAGYNQESAIRRILPAKAIAIVGLSADQTRPTHVVAEYLLAHGKTIIPVNPTVAEVLGQKSYSSLLALPEDIAKKIEIVDVFRKAEDVPQIAKDAIELRKRNANGLPEVFWMQLGIANGAAAEELQKAGFRVVMDRCTRIEHMRLSR
ncbi:CoA binding domain protein [uncultured archaeon]|nr:CoA binding domain protein [uncultured archaeon]